MKAEELMIGDLLIVNKEGLCIKKGSVVRVRGIDADNTFWSGELLGSATCHPLDNTQFDSGIWCDFLDPIPLTPEILEKNGLSKNGVDLALFDRDGGHDYVCGAKLDSVHELQHVLKLCGINKEIVI